MKLTDFLTKREKEVMGLVAAGYSNYKIVDKLAIALSTVKTHLTNIYGKYNLIGARVKNGEYEFMRVKAVIQYLKDERKLVMETVKISKNGATFEMPRENLKAFALYEALQRGIKSGPIHDEKTAIEYLNSTGIEVKIND